MRFSKLVIVLHKCWQQLTLSFCSASKFENAIKDVLKEFQSEVQIYFDKG